MTADSRVFNFGAPELDDSGWTAATPTPLVYQETNGDPIPGGRRDYPTGWPDTTADWIWDRDAGYLGVPAGDVYFRDSFVLAAATTVDVWAAADDAYELWLDGELLLSDGFDVGYLGQSTHAVRVLEAGTHQIAVMGRNLNALAAGVIWTVLELNGAGVSVGVVEHSSPSAVILAYPADPPGFTPGEVVRVLVDEAQARGALAGVVLGFTDAADSAGVPWPVTNGITLQVGMDYLSVMKQLAETYFDLRMRVGSLTLDLFASRGTSTAATLAGGVNLTALEHTGTV